MLRSGCPGFLRKVFALVSMQLLATVAVCALFMRAAPEHAHARTRTHAYTRTRHRATRHTVQDAAARAPVLGTRTGPGHTRLGPEHACALTRAHATELRPVKPCATPCRYCAPVREAVIHMPSLQLLCFFTSIGFLFGCHMNKDSHPTNLYCLAGFTVRRPGQPPPTASSLKPPPLPPPSPLPPTSHLSPPPPLALLPRLHQALREDAPTPTPPQPTTHHPPTPNHTPNHTPAVVDRDKHRHRLRHLPGPRPRLYRAAGITHMHVHMHMHMGHGTCTCDMCMRMHMSRACTAYAHGRPAH